MKENFVVIGKLGDTHYFSSYISALNLFLQIYNTPEECFEELKYRLIYIGG